MNNDDCNYVFMRQNPYIKYMCCLIETLLLARLHGHYSRLDLDSGVVKKMPNYRRNLIADERVCMLAVFFR